jgi:hypothetical protein
MAKRAIECLVSCKVNESSTKLIVWNDKEINASRSATFNGKFADTLIQFAREDGRSKSIFILLL